MVNKKYSYTHLAFDFAQIKTLTLAANRWYYEAPFEKTLASCLYLCREPRLSQGLRLTWYKQYTVTRDKAHS